MFDRIRHSLNRFAIALAVALSMLALALGGGSSHDPLAQAARHVQLDAGLADHGHGHVHDQGADDEKQPGHVHGHNPLDHTHDTYSLPFSTLLTWAPAEREWQPAPGKSGASAPPARLERPPKPYFVG